MTPITDPGEEYFKDGLWAWVTDQWKKLVADAAGHLQVDVLTSGLPTGAATAANQATMITALQLIDDLRNALNSIATDELDVIIDGQSADLHVTQTTPADLTPGIQGWDGSAWHKLPLIFGYSEQYAEVETALNVSAGSASLTFSTVPANEIWIVTSFALVPDQANALYLQLRASTSAGHLRLASTGTVTAYNALTMTTPIILREGNYLIAVYVGAAANDDFRAYANGYKMKIAE